MELTTLLSYVEPYGLPAVVSLGVLVLGRELIRKGFSVHVEVGRKRS